MDGYLCHVSQVCISPYRMSLFPLFFAGKQNGSSGSLVFPKHEVISLHTSLTINEAHSGNHIMFIGSFAGILLYLFYKL